MKDSSAIEGLRNTLDAASANRRVLAIVLVVLLVGLAGCGGGNSSEAETSEDIAENETYTFTKDAAGAEGYWTCIAHDKYTGQGNDNQLECHYVEAGR